MSKTQAEDMPDAGGADALRKRRRRLEARFKGRGVEAQAWFDAEQAVAPALGDEAIARLGAFTTAQVEQATSRLGAIRSAPWPQIEGCLGLLFTSRSGSSLLCRELASRYRIGDMEESLNPHQVEGIAAATIVRAHAEDWFSFKLGVPGIISAELTGVVGHYVAKAHFLLLVRRDIVAQAVSVVKARQRGQWLSTHRPTGSEARYDAAQIARTVRVVTGAVGHLRAYLDLAGRPWRRLAYEDFQEGDFATAMAACDGFGAPRRPPDEPAPRPGLERMSDDTNQAWIARFRHEMDPATRDLVARYTADFG